MKINPDKTCAVIIIAACVLSIVATLMGYGR